MIKKIKGFITSLRDNPIYRMENMSVNRRNVTYGIKNLLWVIHPIFQLIIIGAFYIAAGAYGYDELREKSDSDWVILYFIFFTIQSAYFLIRILPPGAAMIVGEKEKGTYNVLIGSSLRSVDIVKGKFLTLFYPVISELASFYLIILAIFFFSSYGVSGLIMLFLFQSAFLAMATLTSLYASAVSDSIKAAEIKAGRLSFIWILIYITAWVLLIPHLKRLEKFFSNVIPQSSNIVTFFIFILISVLLFIAGGTFFYKKLVKRVETVPSK